MNKYKVILKTDKDYYGEWGYYAEISDPERPEAKSAILPSARTAMYGENAVYETRDEALDAVKAFIDSIKKGEELAAKEEEVLYFD